LVELDRDGGAKGPNGAAAAHWRLELGGGAVSALDWRLVARKAAKSLIVLARVDLVPARSEREKCLLRGPTVACASRDEPAWRAAQLQV